MALGRLGYQNLIESRALDIVHPDVKWTGGILESKKVAAWAETYQLLVAPHNNSGLVATAASAHLAITLPNLLILEVPSRSPNWESEVIREFELGPAGTISLAQLARPGLGVMFDETRASMHETRR
jgi:galactonate dehydratase